MFKYYAAFVCFTNRAVSWITGSGVALPVTSGSTDCSTGLVASCISGGGEPAVVGLGLRLGEGDKLRFLSRFAGDLRRGDGDLVFRLETSETVFNGAFSKNKNKCFFTFWGSWTGPSLSAPFPSCFLQPFSVKQASPVQSCRKCKHINWLAQMRNYGMFLA